MRRRLEAISTTVSISTAVLLLAIVLAGCGSSGSSGAGPAASTQTVTSIPLSSAAIGRGKIPGRYTCDGANVPPPLSWGAVPAGTEEVILFALNVTSTQSSQGPKSVEWAMGGLNPALHTVRSGKRPTGAFVLPASNGKKAYSICPPKGQLRRYEFAVYAMPSQFRAGPTLTGSKLLENLTTGPASYRAPGAGALFATYKRR